MKGLSVKLIQSAPLLLTFGCVHEGVAFTGHQQFASATVTINHHNQYCCGMVGEATEGNKGKVKSHPGEDEGHKAPGASIEDLELETPELKDALPASLITHISDQSLI